MTDSLTESRKVRGLEFKRFLKRFGLAAIDVSISTGLHTNTIYAFIKGESVARRTLTALEKYQADILAVTPPESDK